MTVSIKPDENQRLKKNQSVNYQAVSVCPTPLRVITIVISENRLPCCWGEMYKWPMRANCNQRNRLSGRMYKNPNGLSF